MSDFLKNLRSSRKKGPSDPKRNLDGHFYPQSERRTSPERRSTPSENLGTVWVTLCDILPQMADSISDATDHLEKIARTQELLTEAKIRQCNAVTLFFDNLNKLMTTDVFSPAPLQPGKATTSYASGTRYTKDEVLSMIRTLREQGATFATIAEHLKAKGIPTFSNRGEWHAQTIHRLCK